MSASPGPPRTDPSSHRRRAGSHRGRHRRPVRSRVVLGLRFLAAALLTLIAAVFALPDLLGIDGRSPFAQLAAFRPAVLVAGVVVLVPLVVLTVFRRRAWPFAAGTLAVLLVGAALVLPRALADPLPTAGVPLTVLTFNAYEGEADVNALAELVRTEQPDVVAVIEAGESYRGRLAPLLEPIGYRLRTSTGPGQVDVNGVTTAVAERLGEVGARVGTETSSFPYLELTGAELGTLRFVAFHSVAPVPGSVAQWRDDLALVRRWCAGPTPAIVAGDFNATLDHSLLRAATAGCADAADQRGQGLEPTWSPGPATRPIGPQIDHVFSTTGIAAETFSVHDIPGSDHRAVLTRLRLPG